MNVIDDVTVALDAAIVTLIATKMITPNEGNFLKEQFIRITYPKQFVDPYTGSLLSVELGLWVEREIANHRNGVLTVLL
jgi:hypothetical protein